MPDGFDLDFSELSTLAARLRSVPAAMDPLLVEAVTGIAERVADKWNDNLYREGNAKATGGSIKYTVESSALGVSAQIGASRGNHRQAGIVLLLEYGSVNNPPHGAGHGALASNADRFADAVREAGANALKKGLEGPRG